MSEVPAARPVRDGVVSVIVMAGAATQAAVECLAGLEALDWAPEQLEVIIVTSDRRLERRLSSHGSNARVALTDTGTRLAAGWNVGAEAARGEYLAFLDVDARPGPAWLQAAVTALRADATTAAVASKVVEADGTVAFVDAALTFAGVPLRPHVGKPDSTVYDTPASVLFASRWALIVETRSFRWIGGFDPLGCPNVEHADFGWRLWLAGFGARYEPTSLVHRLPRSTSATNDDDAVGVGALGAIFKNFDDTRVGTALASALLLSDRLTAPGDPRPSEQFFAALPGLNEARRSVQTMRVRTDDEVTQLFRQPMAAGANDEQDVALVRTTLGVDRVFANRHRVLVATPDVLQARMAGPAIRAWEIAKALAREHDVHLVTTVRCALTHPDFPVHHATDAELRTLVDWCDVMIFQGHVMEQHPWLRRTDKVLVADVYDPFHLEVLEQARDLAPPSRRLAVRRAVETLNEQLTRGDFFLCASAKQRDFWLGQLAGIGRLNPATYDHAENLTSLIEVVPFGVSDEAPRTTRPVLKGVVPGIGPGDKVILWGGGVYNWFDPITLLHAVDRLRHRCPDVRLYFMGLRHPNPNVPAMEMAVRVRKLADDLGLAGTHVHFNEGWVDYDDRQNFLLEADIGVSTHLDHVETAFSFRTRILDYLWASVPIVATIGDSFGDLIERRGFGLSVPPGNVGALEMALHRMLTDEGFRESCRAQIAAHVDEFRWSRVLEPILEFSRHPRRAPDLVDPRQRVMLGDPMAQAVWGRRGWRYLARVAANHLRHREYSELGRKLAMRVRLMLDPDSGGTGARPA